MNEIIEKTVIKLPVAEICKDIAAIRERNPLIHNITNYVVMNNTANALLAIGASPVMAHAVEEVEEMASMASAIVINTGTLSSKWIEAMFLAGKKAREKNIPVILDPVGAGATKYRTTTCHQFIKECRPSVIRGNASEIVSLVNFDQTTKGVDSLLSSDNAIDAGIQLAEENRCIVSISGEHDFIISEKGIIKIFNGNQMMEKVTGLGCTASALTGAFCGVDNDYFIASACAMAIMGITGEMAKIKSAGPGSLQLHFIDRLYNLNNDDIEKYFIQ